MSIGPVQSFGPGGEVQPADANLRAARARPSPPPDVTVQQLQPDPGNVPKREAQPVQTSSPQPLSEQYEVQVQPDPELQNELIFKYVDRAGNLVLQVPSAQALSVKRGILEEFQQRASHASTQARRP